MSDCVAQGLKFREHLFSDDFVCQRCSFFDLSALRASVAAVRALAERLTEEGPYSTGSLFFDDAPTTRLRARDSARRDVGATLLALLNPNPKKTKARR